MDPETRHGIRLGLRLALAHHPLCGYFAHDVFGRRLPVCSGCVLTWPLFLVAFPGALYAPTGWDVPPVALVAGGLVAGLPQVVSVFWRGGRIWRAFAKAVGGLGLAALLAGILWLPIGLPSKLAFGAALAAAFGVLLWRRMRSILTTCDACPWQRDWSSCPGFAAPSDMGRAGMDAEGNH